MPVIGRLDEQVEAILITPLRRRAESEAPMPAPHKRAETADEQPRPVAAHDDTVTRREAKLELPVWLL